MLFTTGTFLFLFLPVTLLGFFLAAKSLGPRSAAAWLAAASLFFYAYWRVPDVGLLIASIIFNYCVGSWLAGGRERNPVQARRALIAAIGINLLVLAYFKYANFLVGTLNDLTSLNLRSLDVILPIGISFFTFTQIAYLVDVYAGKVRERNSVHYALFVTYFPHLIAGPVLHHSEMMPQFGEAENYRPRLRNFAIGLAFLAVGLLKKVVIADSVAPLADELFKAAHTQPIDAVFAWRGVLAYTLQIYFDFSGYSDMAVGLSRLIGIELPYNFNSPYKSTSIVEFWRRWHMTLSRFLRDYLYIALGGNRKGVARRYINLGSTMLLGGLWHGASWTFVIWGGLHGMYLMINHGWQHLRGTMRLKMTGGASHVRASAEKCLGWLLTMMCVILAWIVFRADTAGTAWLVMRALVGYGVGATPKLFAASTSPFIWMMAAFAIALLCRNSQEIIDGILVPRAARIESQPRAAFMFGAVVGTELVLIVGLALISASRQITQFIYFNF